MNEKRPGQNERKYSCTVPWRGKKNPPGSSLSWGNVVLLTLGVGGRNSFQWNFSWETSRQMKVSRVDDSEVGVYYSHS